MDNTRTALIEMMRGYQHEPIDYFIGEEVLSVEVISDLSKTFLGCVPVVDFVSALYRVGYTKTGIDWQSHGRGGASSDER